MLERLPRLRVGGGSLEVVLLTGEQQQGRAPGGAPPLMMRTIGRITR
jgi:hypothetical protein